MPRPIDCRWDITDLKREYHDRRERETFEEWYARHRAEFEEQFPGLKRRHLRNLAWEHFEWRKGDAR